MRPFITYVILFNCLLILSPIWAQNVFTGALSEWGPGVEAEVIAGSWNPFAVGIIDENGSFSIPLDTTFYDKLKKNMAGSNAQSDEWTVSLMKLGQAFSCYEQSIDIEGGDQPVIKLSEFGSFGLANIEDKKMYRFFMATNSKDFATSLMSFDAKNTQLGYYVDWYYFEEPAMVYAPLNRMC